MRRRFPVAGIPFLLLWTGISVQIAAPAFASDSEAKLLERLEREHNPVKRAKLEVDLGKLKLEQALRDYDPEDFSACLHGLNAYLERMRSAWNELEGSGRPAARKPQGFLQLEIALRESRRDLEDFESRISYDQREQVEKVRLETERLHDRVLDALFPGARPPKKGQKSASEKPHPLADSKERP